MFEQAEIPCRISDDIAADLWSKMVMNCAYNALSALTRAQYGRMVQSEPVRDFGVRVIGETVAVARAEGVALSLDDSMEAMQRIAAAMPAQFSSTAQDMARGKRSEIDHLNGTVVRLGARHGIAVPVNQALYALVKLIEAARAPR